MILPSHLKFFSFFIFLVFNGPANAGVLKNLDDIPLNHVKISCEDNACPQNYRCALPDLNCDDEGECETTPKCVKIAPPPETECMKNEELVNCNVCEASCDGESENCPTNCTGKVCRCQSGYARDTGGECRRREDCGKCLQECPDNQKCELVDLTCEQLPCKSVEVCTVELEVSQKEDED